MARPASDIADRLLHAARARFLAEGVDGASLRAIARDAGTNLGMVYYYYPSKDALFSAVVEQVYAGLLEDLTAALQDSGEGTAAQLARLYARFARLSDEEQQVLRLILREALGSSSDRLARIFERFTGGHLPLLLETIGRAQKQGALREDLPPFAALMATLALGLLPQLVRRQMAESDLPVDALLPSPDALSALLLRVLQHGIAGK
jgi:AcrR family transcriptional regulator